MFAVRPLLAEEDLSRYSLPSDFNPPALQQQWALATTAVLSNANEDDARQLTESPDASAWVLKNRWGVTNRDSLLGRLDWLRHKGFRADFADHIAKLNTLTPAEQDQVISQVGDDYIRYAGKWKPSVGKAGLLGFDYVLYISLCRWGRSVGYLDDSEAWRFIMPAARLLQHSFGSWQSFGRNYLIGRDYWDASGREHEFGASLVWSYLNLLKSPESLWRALPWNSDLGQGAPRESADSAESSAYLCLFPHPNGWNCFSLTFFQPTKTDDLQPALSQMLGCTVRISRNQLDAGNTLLEGDCVRPPLKTRTHLLVNYPLGPLGQLLQKRHVALLFIEFDHATAGRSLANLSHRWRRNGFDYHLGLRDVASDMAPAVVWFGYSRRDLWLSAVILVFLLLAPLWLGISQVIHRDKPRDGVDVFRLWFRLRLTFWLTWLLRSTVLAALSPIRLFERGENASGAFAAAFTLWFFATVVDLLVALLFRARLKHSLEWNTPWLHLARQVFAEDLCLLPLFMLLLLASDPQQSFTPGSVTLWCIVLIPFQVLALQLRKRIPGSWTIVDENGSLHSRVVSLAQQTGHEIRRILIVRKGEPILREISMPSAHTPVIPQEFLDRLPPNMLDSLIIRAMVARSQSTLAFQMTTLLLPVGGLLVRLKSPSAVGLAGAMPLLIPLIALVSVSGRYRRRLALKADLDTTALTHDPRALISGIMEASRIRNGCPWTKRAECLWLQPTAWRRAQHLADANKISLAEWEALKVSDPQCLASTRGDHSKVLVEK